jgi:hypothetical protein
MQGKVGVAVAVALVGLLAGSALPLAAGEGTGCAPGEDAVPLGEVPPTRRFELFAGGSVDVHAIPGNVSVRVEWEDQGACAVLCEGIAGVLPFACPDTGVAPLWVTLAYVADSSPIGSSQWWLH